MAARELQGGSPRVWEDPLGTPPSLSLPRKSPENLEKVPRIWEGEGPRRSEILNPINNDYWVVLLVLVALVVLVVLLVLVALVVLVVLLVLVLLVLVALLALVVLVVLVVRQRRGGNFC